MFDGTALLRAFEAAGAMDLDLVYRRNTENMARVLRALAPLSPYLRGAPPGLPFRWDEGTLRRSLNVTLTTTRCDGDLLGEITGGGRYEELLPHCVALELFGVASRCLNLEKLGDLGGAPETEAVRLSPPGAEARACLNLSRCASSPGSGSAG